MRLERERYLPARVVDLALRGLRIRRIGIARARPSDTGRVEAALASPAPEQRVQQRDRAAPLRVVAVPGGVAPGMHERRGPVAGHLARGLADDGRLDARLRVGPLRAWTAPAPPRRPRSRSRAARRTPCRRGLSVTSTCIHASSSARSVPGLDRQVVLRLAGGDREARDRRR